MFLAITVPVDSMTLAIYTQRPARGAGRGVAEADHLQDHNVAIEQDPDDAQRGISTSR